MIASPDEVVARWTLELEALVAEGGLFMLTNHPFVSGRASRAAALEALIARAQAIDGLWIATADEIAAHTASLGLEPVVHRRPIVRGLALVGRLNAGRVDRPIDSCAGRTNSRREERRRARRARNWSELGQVPIDPMS